MPKKLLKQSFKKRTHSANIDHLLRQLSSTVGLMKPGGVAITLALISSARVDESGGVAKTLALISCALLVLLCHMANFFWAPWVSTSTCTCKTHAYLYIHISDQRTDVPCGTERSH